MRALEPDPLPARGLAAFVAAAEAGSVVGAAGRLHLTQSAVTKRIQALERRIGAPVLERHRAGVRPTPVGAALLPAAEAALRALATASSAARAAAVAVGTELSLAASHTVGEFLLPGWLASFGLLLPGLHTRVEVVNSTGVLAAVRDGTAEVGFVEGPDAHDGLESLVLHRDEIVVVVAAGHRWAGREVTPRDLRREPFFTREAGSGTRAVALAALAAAGVELRPAVEAASTQSLKRAVLGGGFTLLSRLTIAAEEAAGTLVARPLRGLEIRRDLLAVRRPGPAAPAADRFWSWLRTHPAAADGPP